MSTKANLKFLLKDSFWYGISGALSKAITFFVTPFLTRLLTKEEFLSLDLLLAYAAAFAGFLMMGQDAAIARYFNEVDDNNDNRDNLLSTGFFNHLILILLFSLVYITFSGIISKVFFGEYVYSLPSSLIYLAVATIPGQVLLAYFTNLFKWGQKRNLYILFTLGYSFFYTVLLFFFIGYLQLGVKGAIFASLVSSIGLVIVGAFINRTSLKLLFNINLGLIKKMIVYGLPFGIITVINSILPSIDRFFLLRKLEEPQIAEYALSVKMAALFTLVITSFSISFGPFAFSKWNSENAPNLFALIFKIYSFFLGFVVLVLCAFSPIILKVMAPANYQNALLIFPVLLFAWVFQGLFEITSLGIFYSKKSILYLVSYITTLLISIGANYFLFQFGIFGAAFAVLLTKFSLMLITWYFSEKYFKIPINKLQFLMVLILIVVGIFNYYYFPFPIQALYIVCYVCFGYFVLLGRNEKKIFVSSILLKLKKR